jgi:hypothetical protein
MPAKRYHVRLSSEARQRLKRLVSTGSGKARMLTRARILLLSDEGPEGPSKSDAQVIESLGGCGTTVASVRKRFVQEGLESALHERPRPGQPIKLDGKGKAHLTALACTDPPEGHARWTLRMLADKAVEVALVESLSHETVRQVLKKTR